MSHGLSRRNAGPPCRVLIIDDHDDGRESLRMLLSLMGYRVEAAADGLEGVRKALELRPDVAIVDIGLPKLDGFQVARQLRLALGADITLIAHTAYTQEGGAARVAEAGFDTWLVKPAELNELLPWLNCRPTEQRVPASPRE